MFYGLDLIYGWGSNLLGLVARNIYDSPDRGYARFIITLGVN
jgi:hypothetical protein